MVTIAEYTKSTYEYKKEIEVNKIFRMAIKHNASDIHLQVGRPPVLRIRGGLRELQMDAIDEERMIELTFEMMDSRNLEIFHQNGGTDFSKIVHQDGTDWRFRVNMFTQLGKVGSFEKCRFASDRLKRAQDVLVKRGRLDYSSAWTRRRAGSFHVHSAVLTGSSKWFP